MLYKAHPKVKECAVVGIENEKSGEAVKIICGEKR
jgi:acyl-coenzyme A synthetase/AMP-(fatty) acid ligase